MPRLSIKFKLSALVGFLTQSPGAVSRLVKHSWLGASAVGVIVAAVGGMWLFDRNVIAGLSVSGPTLRITEKRVPVIVRELKKASLEISQGLGYVGEGR